MCVVRVKVSPSIRFVLLACGVLALLLCALGTGLALDTTKPLKQYGRQSWQSDTGLPQNTVHAVVQTRDGFLWMATEGGLVRFDGQEFRIFDTGNTQPLPSDSINDLAVDAHGVLWISCSGGLVRMDGGRFSRVVSNGLDLSAVRFVRPLRGGGVLVATGGGVGISGAAGLHAVAGITGEVTPDLVGEAADGTLWIGTGQQVFAIAPGNTGAREAFSIADIGELQTIAVTNAGELWVGGRSGLALFRNGKRVPLNLAWKAKQSVTSLLPMRSGDVLIGTVAGLVEYSHGSFKALGEKTGPTAGRVLQLFRDREGAVWVAFDLGVARLVRDEVQEPIAIPGVLSIFEDREGDMWFGTDVGGATVLREQAFSTLTTQDGLSDDFVRAVFQDHAGTVWLGTNRGGLNRIAGGQSGGKVSVLHAGGGAGLSSNVVLALAEADGDLWIGTPDGLSRLRGSHLKLFTTADGLPDDFVRSLYTDTDGSLWVGTRNGLSHYIAGKFTSYSRLDGLGSDLVGSILRDSDGILWVGTLDGLSRFDGTGFKNFTQKDGLGGDAITTLAEDSEGSLWIAAHGAGLTQLRSGTFRKISSATSGVPQEIYSVLESGDTPATMSLWLGSSKGIFQVPLATLNALADGRNVSLQAEQFGVADGMKINECSSGGRPAAWKMNDGSLWFATLKGVASVRPNAMAVERVAPLTAIEQVMIDDHTADTTGTSVIVPPARERITIHYAGLSFTAPQKMRFRYMLEGFDRDWVDAGLRRTAYYTNIPAGSYRFLVSASNQEGVWSAAASALTVTVKPRFYRTVWFYLLVLLLSGLAIYAVYRLRVRSVEERYQAVLGERNRIAREIHDTLAQGYVGISVQLELVTRMLQMSGPPGGKSEIAIQQLESTKELVRSSLSEARSSIWNLRSQGAESDTLPARLAATVRAKQQEGGPVLRLEVRGSFRPVQQRVEDEVLRIAQEGISNAFRHAGANEVGVLLEYDTGWLKLIVSDDGKGFDRSAVGPGHYGLQGIEERAAQIGANLAVHSTPGAGTRIVVAVDVAGTKELEQA